MPNPTTAESDAMDLQACCDFIAVAKGWQNTTEQDGYEWHHNGTGETIRTHPIPPTLDTIAGCLPEGWRWGEIIYYHRRSEWGAMVERDDNNVRLAGAPTELLSRARAVCKAWAASKGPS